MNENSNIVPLRQPDAIDDPLTHLVPGSCSRRLSR